MTNPARVFLNDFESQPLIECLGACICHGHIQNTFPQPGLAGKLDLVPDQRSADPAAAQSLLYTELEDQASIGCKRRHDSAQLTSAAG